MKTSALRFVTAPEIVKVTVQAVILILFSSTFVTAALGQTPSKTLTPQEQELLKAQKAREDAEAEYYRVQTAKLAQPTMAPTPTPVKTFSQSVAENPASVVGVVGTILAAIIVALVSLTTLYFNSRNAIKAQKDSQFYEAMKRMGDKDSPTMRASAAGLLALMARQEWREPVLSKKWPYLKLENSRSYFDTAVDQLVVGHLLESNPVVTESIKNALQLLVPLAPHNISAITRELYAANVSLQDKLASLIAEFFVINNCHELPNPWEEDQDVELWEQLQSVTGFETRSLKKLVTHSSSFTNSFGAYRLVIDAQNTGDRGLLLSALHDKLRVASGHLRANVTLFCTALSKLQPKDLSQAQGPRLYRFERAFLVGGEISDANLSNVEFRNADFTRVRLSNVNLENTWLSGAALDVEMDGGSLRNSFLLGADLDGARIWDVDLTNARLAEAGIPTSILDSAWWKADFDSDDKLDTALLEFLFEQDSQSVPSDSNEVHPSVRIFLESKRKPGEQVEGSPIDT